MRSTSAALVVAAVLLLPGLACAQLVTLACAHAPGQAPGLTIDIDLSRAVVNYPAPNTPVRISERRIEWHTARQVFPSGETRYAGSFAVDRVTGTFHRSFDCNACAPDTLYCAPRSKMF